MSEFTLSVINIGGRDSNQFFRHGAGFPTDPGHAPVNYHAYSSCVNGAFLQDFEFTSQFENFIFLLRSDLPKSLSNIKKLRKQKPNSKIVLMFKETGPFQLYTIFEDPKNLILFSELISLSNGIISPTPFLNSFYKNFTDKLVEFIPTPYPFHSKEWNFSIPSDQKKNIYLATREFDIDWRMHLYSLGSIRKWIEKKNIKLTVVNQDGNSGKKWFKNLGFSESNLNLIDGKLNYTDYLKLLAKHQLIVNPDLGMVPGQIAGDSLLVKTPVIGGNSILQEIIYPELTTKSADYDFIIQNLEKFYSNMPEINRVITESIERSEKEISFGVIGRRLETFFKSI